MSLVTQSSTLHSVAVQLLLIVHGALKGFLLELLAWIVVYRHIADEIDKNPFADIAEIQM